MASPVGVIDSFTPRLRENPVSPSTMRASIITCGVGWSIRAISSAICVTRASRSVTNSRLVRASAMTEPRFDNTRWLPEPVRSLRMSSARG